MKTGADHAEKTKVDNLKKRLEEEKDAENPDQETIDQLEDQLEEAQEALREAIEAARADVGGKLQAWVDDIDSSVKREIRSSGFEEYPDDYVFTQEQIDFYKLNDSPDFFKMQLVADLTHRDYYKDGTCVFWKDEDLNKYHSYYQSGFYEYIPPIGFELWEEDLEVLDRQNHREAAKRRDLGNRVPTLFNTFYNRYQGIAALCQGYDDSLGTDFLKMADQTVTPYFIKLNKIPSDPGLCDF